MRRTISMLLLGAALTIASAADATGRARRCDVTACEWDCEGWKNERRYDRCMRVCLNECSRRRPPDWKPESQPDEDDKPIAVGILGLVALALLALVLCIKRRRDRRISTHCMLVAHALEREAAGFRAEAFRRNPDL